MRPVARTDISANEVSQRKELYRNPSHKGGHRAGTPPALTTKTKYFFGVEEFASHVSLKVCRVFHKSLSLSMVIIIARSSFQMSTMTGHEMIKVIGVVEESIMEGRSSYVLNELLIMYCTSHDSIIGYCHGANNDGA